MNFMQKNKGVITVMLTILLMPMLACGSLLIELARYKSLQNLYSEIADNAILSAMAGYNTELYEKYALLAMDGDQSDVITHYVTENLNMGTDDFSKLVTDSGLSVTANGLYSLANTQVLKRQIMESEKLNAPVSLSIRLLSGGEFTLDSLLKDLKSKIEKAIPGSKMIKNISKSASNLADVADAATKIIEEKGKWNTAVNEYTDAYRNFQDALNSYIDARDAYNDSIDSDTGLGDADLFAERELKSAALDLNILAYKNAIGNLESKAESFLNAAKDIIDKAVTFKSTLDTQGIDKEKDNTDKEVDEWLKQAKEAASKRTDLTADAKEILIENYEMEANAIKQQATQTASSLKTTENVLVGIANKCSSFDSSAVLSIIKNYTSNLKDRLNNLSKPSVSKEDLNSALSNGSYYYYTTIQLGGLEISQLLTDLKVLEEDAFESVEADLKEVLRQLYNLLRMFLSTFTGYELAADVTLSNYDSLPSRTGAGENDTFISGDDAAVEAMLNQMADMARQLGYDISEMYPSSRSANAEFNSYIENLIDTAVNSVQTICSSMGQVISALTGKYWEMLKALKSLVDAFDAAVTLCEVLPQIVENFGSAIESMVSSLYEGALIQEYAFRHFTSRMDFKASAGALTSSGSGTKFVTAELEYIINGSSSEKSNQKSAAFFIFVIRLLANMACILSDSNIAQTASAAGPFAPLVYIAWIALETLIDMFLLQETTAKIPLIKDPIFLSVEGIAELSESFIDKISGFSVQKSTAETLDEIEKTIGGTVDAMYKDDKFRFSYEDYLWIRMCFVGNTRKVRRIADLIQMNMSASDSSFALDQEYTYLRVRMEGGYSPMMPTFHLVPDGWMSTVKYAGY